MTCVCALEVISITEDRPKGKNELDETSLDLYHEPLLSLILLSFPVAAD